MKSHKAEPISEEPSAGGFTIGEQSTAWEYTVVVCDWVNTEAEQKILREITWQFEHLRNLVGAPLSVKVSKRDAAPKEPAPVVQGDVSAKFGGHYYPGCADDDNFFTSDCAHGCGCWMGSSRSGGPDGVDPFGPCPNTARAGKREDAR